MLRSVGFDIIRCTTVQQYVSFISRFPLLALLWFIKGMDGMPLALCGHESKDRANVRKS